MQIKHTFLFILLIGCVGNRRGKRVVALQVRFNNERGDVLVTTPPPAIEISQPSDAELLFPHLVNGGGYTTQFILSAERQASPQPETCSSSNRMGRNSI